MADHTEEELALAAEIMNQAVRQAQDKLEAMRAPEPVALA
jgi:hypothetical protein